VCSTCRASIPVNKRGVRRAALKGACWGAVLGTVLGIALWLLQLFKTPRLRLWWVEIDLKGAGLHEADPLLFFLCPAAGALFFGFLAWELAGNAAREGGDSEQAARAGFDKIREAVSRLEDGGEGPGTT